ATDLSATTAQAVERLAVYLFPFYPSWSTTQLAVIYRERGRISVYELESYLSDAEMPRIGRELTPVMQSWQKHEREGLLITLGYALGRRLRVYTELLDLLASVLDYTQAQSTANAILQFFWKHDPERLARLVPHLVVEDKSSIVLSVVYTYLHRK